MEYLVKTTKEGEQKTIEENAIKNRYDFMILLDVENCNPNGDPAAGNMPRIDVYTNIGLVSDVCLKRKIRDYVENVKKDAIGYRIYYKRGVPLEIVDNEIFASAGIEGAAGMSPDALKKAIKKSGKDVDLLIHDYLMNNFFDIRTFGAVVNTAVNCNLDCGRIRGPVQLAFSRSVDPIYPQKLSDITEQAKKDKKRSEFFDKWIIPYGLYCCDGFISANLAQETTGFSEEDLELLWDAILNMFTHKHESARGKMTVRKLIIFKHESKLGNVPAHKLFDLIKVEKAAGVDIPKDFNDYVVTVDTEHLPNGVHCEIRE
jgi:CRISPR-associated protein Csd2